MPPQPLLLTGLPQRQEKAPDTNILPPGDAHLAGGSCVLVEKEGCGKGRQTNGRLGW